MQTLDKSSARPYKFGSIVREFCNNFLYIEQIRDFRSYIGVTHRLAEISLSFNILFFSLILLRQNSDHSGNFYKFIQKRCVFH